jgi:hypothetical protein
LTIPALFVSYSGRFVPPLKIQRPKLELIQLSIVDEYKFDE